MKHLVKLFAAIAVSTIFVGCANTNTSVRDLAIAAQAVHSINNDSSFSQAGLTESLNNCARDWLDTNNRGSGCHRSK